MNTFVLDLISGQLSVLPYDYEELKMSTRFLKVKLKSLAEEARIIRLEETRSSGMLRDQLRNHRVVEVRREARATHLAYAMLRGRTRSQTEQGAYEVPDVGRVIAMARKYGGKSKEEVLEWLRPDGSGTGISTPVQVGSIPAAASV